jgi:thiol-disulfide isomerase/thioredoxin
MVTSLLALLLFATACSNQSGISLETTTPLIDDTAVVEDAAPRTTTSLGLSADDEGTPESLAYIDEDRIEVGTDDPAIEPFVFFAEALTSGEMIDGLDLYRDRPALITFSVPTCPVCTREAPEIAAAAERYPGINFVMVHSQGDTESYDEFVTTAGLDGPDNVMNLVDDELELWRRFSVIQQPTSILIDADGHVSSTRGALASEGLDIVAAMLELRELPTFDHLSPERPTNPDA